MTADPLDDLGMLQLAKTQYEETLVAVHAALDETLGRDHRTRDDSAAASIRRLAAEAESGRPRPPRPPTTPREDVVSDIDTIRRAAEVLREAAQGATPGVWGLGNGTHLATEVEQTSRGSFAARYSIAEMEEDDRESWMVDEDDNPAAPEDDGTYIVLVQPSVGLAVAAWLQDEADGCQALDGNPTAPALAVATAILAIDAELEAVEKVTG